MVLILFFDYFVFYDWGEEQNVNLQLGKKSGFFLLITHFPNIFQEGLKSSNSIFPIPSSQTHKTLHISLVSSAGTKHSVQNILTVSPIFPADAFSLRKNIRNNNFLGPCTASWQGHRLAVESHRLAVARIEAWINL
jgi:hypothetical protein